jgi:cytoskeletal protein RodZ
MRMGSTLDPMNSENQTPRERGRRLLGRINRWAIAGAIGLAGLFSFVAAETTHGKTTASTTTTLSQPSSTPTASSSSSTSSNSGNSGNSGASGSTGNTGSSSVVSGGS